MAASFLSTTDTLVCRHVAASSDRRAGVPIVLQRHNSAAWVDFKSRITRRSATVAAFLQAINAGSGDCEREASMHYLPGICPGSCGGCSHVVSISMALCMNDEWNGKQYGYRGTKCEESKVFVVQSVISNARSCHRKCNKCCSHDYTPQKTLQSGSRLKRVYTVVLSCKHCKTNKPKT